MFSQNFSANFTNLFTVNDSGILFFKIYPPKVTIFCFSSICVFDVLLQKTALYFILVGFMFLYSCKMFFVGGVHNSCIATLRVFFYVLVCFHNFCKFSKHLYSRIFSYYFIIMYFFEIFLALIIIMLCVCMLLFKMAAYYSIYIRLL